MGRNEEIAYHVSEILALLGEDPTRDGLKETPQRVTKYLLEVTEGLRQPLPDLKVFEGDGYNDMVIVKGITFNSTCEHHVVPFRGKAHIGYIPNGKIVGLSKFVRVVDHFAHRLQVQERLTEQVADYIEEQVQPQGVIVVMEAEHQCMVCRGVKRPGSTTITSAIRGNIDKAEFLELLKLEG